MATVNSEVYEKEELRRGLKSRHLQMIAIGGTLGTGLFYGSGWAVSTAGPAVILTYAVAAVAIYFVMRALGEMSVEEPVSGAYVSYANRYIHRFAGFLNGWNALVFLLATSAAELNALGHFAQYWFPDLPIWVAGAVAVTLMFMVNMIGVNLYGEAEFWFAVIKVVAIVAMILLGVAMIVSGVGHGGRPIGFGNLVHHDGFFPHGLTGVMLATVIVAFSFGGVETLGITAGEAEDINTSMPKAVSATFWRLMIFYIGAITVLVTLFPWSQLDGEGSPFVTVFRDIGIPAAATIMNLVVITAVLSAVNANIFTNSRTFYNLALQGNAPAFLGTVNHKNVPAKAVGVVFAAVFGSVLLNVLMPDHVFEIFSSVTVFGLVCAWASIMVSHLKFRRLRIQSGQAHQLRYKMPFYPYGNYLALVFVAVILVGIGVLPETRTSLYVSGGWLLVVYVGYRLQHSKSRVSKVAPERVEQVSGVEQA